MIKDEFFNKMEALGLALTFDDVRLKSSYSETDPTKASVETLFSKRVPLKYPIVSAAMDTITEAPMAIAMAKLGGLGIIHRGLDPETQAHHVKKVKLHLNGLIEIPITTNPEQIVQEILNKCEEKNYSFQSFPVVDIENKLIGIITKNDFEMCTDNTLKIKDVMTTIPQMITAPKGTTLEEAYKIILNSKKKALPLIDENQKLAGMYVFSDLVRLLNVSSNSFNIDAKGHLRVGAAVGVGADAMLRAKLLSEAGVDVMVIDTAHGDSKNVIDTLKELKQNYPHIDVVAGNVSEGASAKRLVDAGADGVKVGQGPGSICTTRIVAGIGCPQVTAVYNCAKAIRGSGVPIIADGGIKHSGDLPIALGAGAHCVVLGRGLAGTTETPGDIKETSSGRFKVYRGMGSLGAMKSSIASRERYRQDKVSIDKVVPEGVESIVPYQGDVSSVIHKMVGGLKSGMGYVGAESITMLQEKADYYRISNAGLAESHPHDIVITDKL
ncbi:MAG: guaB [Candidatus Taylorbacteria bacterium]|nr:guaB [Candidatus Taylorbacteria bacterium]